MLLTIAFLHRYTGVAVGWLMTLWCLSGFVMMYQGYPELTNAERLRGLASLNLNGCCQNPPALPVQDLSGTRINMVSGVPVLRVPGAGAFDLRSGEALPDRTAQQVQEIAASYGRGAGLVSAPSQLAFDRIDQWTLMSAGRNHPVHHLAFNDAAGSEVYVSGNSGEVIQDTNRRERTWAWMGAIPHWLYPTVLRSKPRVWTQVVIWTAAAGTFLTVAGLFLGVSRINWRRRGRKFPFRGLWNWHHIAGVFFGVLALTWVFSGLMTMNPWGLLENNDDGIYGHDLTGTARWQELQRFMLEHGDELSRYVEIQVTPFNGVFHVTAFRQDGSSQRLNAMASNVEIQRADVAAASAHLGARVLSLDSLRQEDAYYYGHKQAVALPVFRLILDDVGHTRIYVDPATGTVQTLDLNSRRTRWWESALHNMDLPGLRTRPVWDFIVLLLLARVTAVCATGTWLAWRVLR
ncbi:MAG: PepSY domain-containing protein [Pseudomonadota bacterium]